MRIDILCRDGSPLGVTVPDLYGEGQRGIGTGGSEYALLTMCEAWSKAGHDVILYNNPKGRSETFEQRRVDEFDPNQKRDVIITFRTPNEKSLIAKGMKVWWSCDQYTSVSFKPFAPHMEKIVCISDFHKEYFKNTYQIYNTTVIDLPVRLNDIDGFEVKKVPKKCMFTSVPDRGLMDLYRMWDSTISVRDPEASLVITSDYRLWGVDERNTDHRARWLFSNNVSFLGAIPRRQLIQEQLSSQLLVYPSVYDELFCVSVAEAEACGMYTITSDTGALPTTNMGTVIPRSVMNYPSTFAHKVVELLNDPNLPNMQREIRQKAVERFSVENIMKQWDERVFK